MFMVSSAVISECGTYRYNLKRTWDNGGTFLGIIMLNPSTADGLTDDPTIRKCMTFARLWGHGGIRVCNLFAYRSTDPRKLPRDLSISVGPKNDYYIARMASLASEILVAWGQDSLAPQRAPQVLELIKAYHDSAICLKQNQDGSPAHPLYIALKTKPIPFSCNAVLS